MATIPLPALDIRPVQPQSQPMDILGQLGKVTALRSALMQQAYQEQVQPLQLQQEQMRLQLQQRQLNSQDAFFKAFQQSPTGSTDDLMQNAVKQGAYPADVFPILESLNKYQLSNQDLRGKQLDNAQKVNDAQGEQAQMLLNIKDPAERQQAWQNTTMPAMQALGVPANAMPAQVPNDQWLQAHASMAMRVDKQLENARQQQTFEQEHGVIPPDRLATINGLNTQIAQTYRIPPTTLPPGSTWDDYKTVDKLMEYSGRAQATQAQIATANGFRQQAQALSTLAAEEKIAQLNKPTPAEQNRADLASNALENLNTLQDIVTRRPDLFGKFAGRMTAARGAIGTSDADIATLHDITDNFGRASQGAHAMKGMGGVADAINAVTNGMHNSPEATQKAIDAARKSLETFQQQEEAARSGARSGFTPSMVPGATALPQRTPAVAPPAARPPGPSVGGPPAGYTRIQGSDGKPYDIPTQNLGQARQIDPGLKVIQP